MFEQKGDTFSGLPKRKHALYTFSKIPTI